MSHSCLTILRHAAFLALPVPLAAQAAPRARIKVAQAEIRAGRLERAAVLLQSVTDSSGGGSLKERVDAWVWLGIVDFSRGDRPAAARDFDNALLLDPSTKVHGLAERDSALDALWDRRRTQAMCGDSVGAWAADGTPLSPRQIKWPSVLVWPNIAYPPHMLFLHVQGRVLTHAVIDTSGRAEPASIGIVESPDVEFDSVVRDAFVRARFKPGRVGDQPVRTCITMPVDFKISPGDDTLRVAPHPHG